MNLDFFFFYFSACLFLGIQEQIMGMMMLPTGIVDFIVMLGNILVAEEGENEQ